MNNIEFQHGKGEELKGTQVKDDILCKDCKKRDGGTIYSNHHTKGSCQAYPYPDMKPLDILFEGSRSCEYYEKEKK